MQKLPICAIWRPLRPLSAMTVVNSNPRAFPQELVETKNRAKRRVNIQEFVSNKFKLQGDKVNEISFITGDQLVSDLYFSHAGDRWLREARVRLWCTVCLWVIKVHISLWSKNTAHTEDNTRTLCQFLGDINFGASCRSSGRWPCLFVVLCRCLKLNEEIIYGRRRFIGVCGRLTLS